MQLLKNKQKYQVIYFILYINVNLDHVLIHLYI